MLFFIDFLHGHLVFLDYLFIVIQKAIDLVLSVGFLNIDLTQIGYNQL